MNNIEKTLQAFFDSEAKVIVIKGDWGVGKTYFWDSYISKKISSGDLSQLAYSYISLFGSSSLGDVRKRVFHSAKRISSSEKVDIAFQDEYKKSNALFDNIPWLKESASKLQSNAPLISSFSNKLQELPLYSKFSGVISSLEYSLVKNYIVCFDDLERKGKGLEIKELMGLIDELAQRKDCKVILIFNESTFDDEGDRKQFDSYREKVVDTEISYNPNCNENFACVFPNDYEKRHVIEKVVKKLNIRNIRVIKKIKWAFECFYKYVDTRDSQIIDEMTTHIVLFCYFYYMRDDDLTYELLKEQISNHSFLSLFKDKDKKASDGELKYINLASSLELSSSVFDLHIDFFLRNGYVDDDALKATVIEFEEKICVDSVNSRLRLAWAIYSDSFSDNYEDFKNTLTNILNEEMQRISFSEFYSVIDTLEDLGEDVTSFVNNYVATHAELLSGINLQHSWDLGRFKCRLLKDEIEKLQKITKNLSLDSVSSKIAKDRIWDSEDVDFLNTLSKDDYIEWMKGNPGELVMKIRSGLLSFGSIKSSGSIEAKFKNITDNVVLALKEIASENEFNKYRIKLLYGIE